MTRPEAAAARRKKASPLGSILREWRAARRISQLGLAMDAGISSRHLSFLETGRAEPSRDMVLRLARALDMPFRERNALLLAAGYAAIYRETPLAAEEMQPVRQAVECILSGFGPNPAILVNRRYDILSGNPAAAALMRALLPIERAAAAPRNMAQLVLGPDWLRPVIANWTQAASALLRRLRYEPGGADEVARLVASYPDLARLVESTPDCLPSASRPFEVVLPVQFCRDDLRLSLFSTITTLGTPLDITLQELRIEASFPADAQSAEALRELTTR